MRDMPIHTAPSSGDSAPTKRSGCTEPSNTRRKPSSQKVVKPRPLVLQLQGVGKARWRPALVGGGLAMSKALNARPQQCQSAAQARQAMASLFYARRTWYGQRGRTAGRWEVRRGKCEAMSSAVPAEQLCASRLGCLP